MNVVAFDTAGPVIGVALLSGGELRQRTERIARGAEARLVPWVEALCGEAGLSRAAIEGVAVTCGPGAFTGIRVGLATAAGLALGLDRPLWTTSSLATRAARVGADVLVLLDARKGRVYAQAFGAGEGPADIAPEEAVGWMSGPFVATGEGALVYEGIVRSAGGRVADGADDPSVGVLATLAAEGLQRGEGSDPVAVRPLYLRAPDIRRTG